MEATSKFHWLFLLYGLFYLTVTLQVVQGVVESEGPSESECRPFIEKALKELEIASEPMLPTEESDSKEDLPTVEITTEDDSLQHEGEYERTIETEDDADTKSSEEQKEEEPDESKEDHESVEETRSGEDQKSAEDAHSDEVDAADAPQATDDGSQEDQGEGQQANSDGEQGGTSPETEDASAEDTSKEEEPTEGSDEKPEESAETHDEKSEEEAGVVDERESMEEETREPVEEQESVEESAETHRESEIGEESAEEQGEESLKDQSRESGEEQGEESIEEQGEESIKEQGEKSIEEGVESVEEQGEESIKEQGEESIEEQGEESIEEEGGELIKEHGDESVEEQGEEKSIKEQGEESIEEQGDESIEEQGRDSIEEHVQESVDEQLQESREEINELAKEETDEPVKEETDEPVKEETDGSVKEETDAPVKEETNEPVKDQPLKESTEDAKGIQEVEVQADVQPEEEQEGAPEEELIIEGEIPDELRPTDHIAQLLKLNEEHEQRERIIGNVAEITLRDLKRLYENAIKPLETLYKYRDLSNRHFGDAEIFAKPLVLFMGPWSGGKSSIINYLADNEYNETSLRTGAEPSPAYFNIMMYGDEAEVLDGTQLAADFTFSGLQKFGQGLEERLRGLKLPKKILEKINIVEIPGILEVRKQISRVFPFNDACQWFIDRADIIFLVYDPSKLDVGPETEAILDQLKGREHQTRIILNKADQVKPEELMRVQGALIWNISPLMSSAQPPVMYTTSLWSRPYEPWAPVRLLQAQERAFLRDLRTAVDKRIENRIASARRFAVRVRNHAKMVDCYLTTYYNHKSVFGNRKQVSDAIIEHPQDYHIYEGLSTLTNISRYDLPDPDVYRDFFRLNPLYDFQQLSATCTYFRGCPINRLDVAIAYDLPELVGKHKKMVEEALSRANLKTPTS